MNTRQRLAVIVTTVIAVFTLTAASTSTASAVGAAGATPTMIVAPQHGAYQNGCSFSPDRGPWWDFHSSCDRHDLCYHYHYYGGGYYGRLACDNEFRSNMYASCRARYGSLNPLRYACYRTADEYYNWVRALGGAFF